MTFQGGANLYTQGFGSHPESVEIPVISTRNPGSHDTNYPIGKRWVNTVQNAAFVLTSQATVNGITTSAWTAQYGSNYVAISGITPAMVAGLVTVNNAAITTSSIVIFTMAVVGIAPALSSVAVTNGSFAINSLSNTDTSSYYYIVVNSIT